MTQHLHNCRVIIPTEGYGFSNDANAVLGTPSKATIVDAALNLRNPREMPHWDN